MTWIGTVSGERLDYLNPLPERIRIEDIATGLSNGASRFVGQLEKRYTVAQHSVMVAYTVWVETKDPVISMQALLHDASEAYTGDCPTL